MANTKNSKVTKQAVWWGFLFCLLVKQRGWETHFLFILSFKEIIEISSKHVSIGNHYHFLTCGLEIITSQRDAIVMLNWKPQIRQEDDTLDCRPTNQLLPTDFSTFVLWHRWRSLLIVQLENWLENMTIYWCTLFENYWKCRFWILAFSTNFCPTKSDLSGNTVWPQASGFQKLAKMDHFWHF